MNKFFYLILTFTFLLFTACTENTNIVFDDIGNLSQGYLAVKQNDKWGFISEKGKYLFTPQFDEVTDFSDNLAFVKKNDRWGLVDINGKIIVEPMFEDIGNDSGYVIKDANFYSALKPVKQNNKWGYINKKGKYVITPQFDEASNFSDEFATVKKDGQGFVIDKDNKIILTSGKDKEFFEIFINKFVRVSDNKNNRWAILNLEGKFNI